MGQPVVHFEVIGQDPEALRGATTATCSGGSSTRAARCRPRSPSPRTTGSSNPATDPGSRVAWAAAPAYPNRVLFYVGVANVEAALQQAESLGGTRRMGPEHAPGRDLVVGHFTDPEGNLIGVAGTA